VRGGGELRRYVLVGGLGNLTLTKTVPLLSLSSV